MNMILNLETHKGAKETVKYKKKKLVTFNEFCDPDYLLGQEIP